MRTIGFRNGKFMLTAVSSGGRLNLGSETTPQAGDQVWPFVDRTAEKIRTALRKHGLDLDNDRVI